MSHTNELIVISVLTITLAIIGRILLSRFLHTDRPAVRFWSMAGLFLLYTLALVLMLNQAYLFMADMNAAIGDYHKVVILTICSANIVVAFIALANYFIRGKHRLSGDDKMKLMDL